MSDKNKQEREENLKDKVLSSSGWGFLDKGSNIIVNFIIGIILARLLPPSDFGLIGLAMIVIGFGQIFVNLGLGPSLVQKKVITERHIRVVFTTSVLAGLTLAAVVFLGAPLAEFILDNQNVIPIVKSLSVVFLIGGLQIPSRSILNRKMEFRHIFYVSLAQSLIYGIVTVILAINNFGVWSLVIGNIVQQVISFTGSYWYVKHSIKPLFAKKEIKDLSYFGSGMTLNGIFNYFALRGDYFMIGRIIGAEALGLYTKAYNLMQSPTTQFVHVLSNVLFPTASKIQNDNDRLRNVFLKAMKTIAFIVMPICTLFVVIAPELIIGLYGSKWEGAVLPLQILGGFGGLRAMYNASDAFLKAKGLVFKILIGQFAYGFSMLVGVWFGATYFGLAGASWAVGVSIAVIWSIFMELNCRSMHIKRLILAKVMLPGFLLSIIVALPTILANYILVNFIASYFIRLLIISTVGMLSFLAAVLFVPQIVFQNLPSELFAICKKFIPEKVNNFMVKNTQIVEIDDKKLVETA